MAGMKRETYDFTDCQGCVRDCISAWKSLDICTKCCRAYASPATKKKYKDQYEKVGDK